MKVEIKGIETAFNFKIVITNHIIKRLTMIELQKGIGMNKTACKIVNALFFLKVLKKIII